ncbi:MAG: hypothetical protein ACLR6B_09165 [Blautia sp.]
MNTANTAKSTAEGAVSTANNAKSTADAAKSSVEGLEFGGRNLVRNTSDEWSKWYKPVTGENSTFTFYNGVTVPDGSKKVTCLLPQ